MKGLKVIIPILLLGAIGIGIYKHMDKSINYSMARKKVVSKEDNFMVVDTTDSLGREGWRYVPVDDKTAILVKDVLSNMQNIRFAEGEPDKKSEVRLTKDVVNFYKNGFETDLAYFGHNEHQFYTCDNYDEIYKRVQTFFDNHAEESNIMKYYQ